MLELRAGHEIDLRQLGVGREKTLTASLEDPISQEKASPKGGDGHGGDAYRPSRIFHDKSGRYDDRNGRASEPCKPQRTVVALLAPTLAATGSSRHRIPPEGRW
ncbi:hypothetical protein ACFQYP_58430 [Nonomuraea antimicrobica]